MQVTPYSLVRTGRRTICLRILEDGTLQVRAPLRASSKVIDQVVEQNAAWICARRLAALTQNAARGKICLYPGGRMLYRGSWYPVAKAFAEAGVSFDGRAFFLPSSPEPDKAMEAWLKAQAKSALSQKAAVFAAKMGVSYRQVKIGSAVTRWGSCSGKGNLNFTFRVLLLPERLLDYVVVHELCHLRQMNHSPAFWAEVEKQMPDYAIRRRELAALHKEIDFIHWTTTKEP